MFVIGEYIVGHVVLNGRMNIVLYNLSRKLLRRMSVLALMIAVMGVITYSERE